MNARLVVLLALAAGAIACRAKLATETPTYQEQKYVFPHSTHVDADVACTNCHAMPQAKKLEADVRHVALPKNPSKQAACKDCHDTDPKITIPKRTTPFRLTFDHAAHLPRVNGDCKRCHVQQPEAGATSYQWPAMAACTSCHNHQQDFVQARCMPCHTDLKGYAKPVSAFAHQGDWLHMHAALARESGESCAACHDQTFCAECHSPTTTPGRPSITYPERVDRTFIHRGDYVSRHMIEQAANPSSCRKCHGSGFCESCHQQEGLSKFVPDFRRPASHEQPNWALATAGTLPKHAQAARRDITNCAGCHDQGAQATCVGCHRVGGIATNPANPNGPHPTSFITKHRGEDKSKNSICAACHL